MVAASSGHLIMVVTQLWCHWWEICVCAHVLGDKSINVYWPLSQCIISKRAHERNNVLNAGFNVSISRTDRAETEAQNQRLTQSWLQSCKNTRLLERQNCNDFNNRLMYLFPMIEKWNSSASSFVLFKHLLLNGPTKTAEAHVWANKTDSHNCYAGMCFFLIHIISAHTTPVVSGPGSLRACMLLTLER